ncbi:pyroglutamyl-peptidase [Microbacterium sp. cf046]|uniref:pyroglutamyl-peptidase I n=1 Tax=Microbacterium sp. cf046 TaxID=1761803 RepID=UPI0008DFA3AE|nr:pyroglutamyl-peptidase I [Microbacterium sp. cf046]SFS00775.1 pyroglutamyl-peptidase [Microbacterium sp. cf046]
MTTVLLTGFEPFGGDQTNPSGAAVHLVAAQWSGPEVLITAVLPVTFEGAADRMRALIAEHEPDAVIASGLAGGRSAVGVERVAVNLIDARIPDNDGVQPIDSPSVESAPPAHFSSLPVKAIAGAIRDAGIPAEVSFSAGTFVCNHVFFVTMQTVAAHVRAGFIHVPCSSEHSPRPDAASLPLADIARALEIAVRTTLSVGEDVRVPGGSIH